MNTENSPTPWSIQGNAHEGRCLCDANGNLIGDRDNPRIVACVNACAGIVIPSDALKKVRKALSGSARMHRQLGQKIAAAACDEALAALGGGQ